MADSPAKIIRHKITRLLSRREHSQHEIRQKLLEMRHGLAERSDITLENLNEVLQQFTEKDIQSDQRYAEAVVRGAFRKGKGPTFIQRSLQEHDIELAMVRELIESDDFDWFELARAVRVKRFGEEEPSDWNTKQKQMRFLQYRGFNQEQIKYAFD